MLLLLLNWRVRHCCVLEYVVACDFRFERYGARGCANGRQCICKYGSLTRRSLCADTRRHSASAAHKWGSRNRHRGARIACHPGLDLRSIVVHHVHRPLLQALVKSSSLPPDALRRFSHLHYAFVIVYSATPCHRPSRRMPHSLRPQLHFDGEPEKHPELRHNLTTAPCLCV